MLIMPLAAGLRLCQVWGHTKEGLIATISGACMGVVRTVGSVRTVGVYALLVMHAC